MAVDSGGLRIGPQADLEKERAMSTLAAIAYPDRDTAEKVRQELINATREHSSGSRTR